MLRTLQRNQGLDRDHQQLKGLPLASHGGGAHWVLFHFLKAMAFGVGFRGSFTESNSFGLRV